jgi:hypothetical protein
VIDEYKHYWNGDWHGRAEAESLLHDVLDLKLCLCGENSLLCRGVVEPVDITSV